MDLPEDKATLPTDLPAEPKPLLRPNKLSGMLVGFGLSLLLVAGLSVILGEKIGYERGVTKATAQLKQTTNGEEVSAKNVKELRLKAETLQSQLTTAQQERDISLANLNDLRNDMQNLTVTNLQLEQGREFLTTALAKRGGIGLQVIGAKIVPLPEDAYEYRFDIGYVDGSNQEKTLVPRLTLLDDVNMVVVPLQPSTYKINGIARVRGRFMMPKDFVPKQMKIELAVGGQKVEHVYDWEIGQPIDDLPYTLEETPTADQRPVKDDEDTASVPASSPSPTTDSVK